MSLHYVKAFLFLLEIDPAKQRLYYQSGGKALQHTRKILGHIKEIIQYRLQARLSCTDKEGINYEERLRACYLQAKDTLDCLVASTSTKLWALRNEEDLLENPKLLVRESSLYHVGVEAQNTIKALDTLYQSDHHIVHGKRDNKASEQTCTPKFK